MSNTSWKRPLPSQGGSGHAAGLGRGVVDAYPLAPMQLAMLLRGQVDPRAGLYVQQYVCTLREALRLPEFRRAWQRLAARHPVLRTSFLLDASPEPLQQVHAGVEVPWSEHDWRDLPEEAQEEAMRAFLREDRSTPLDPRDAPLARFALFRLRDEVYRLVWTSHHALFDGHSRRILLREVFADYDALVEGRDAAPAARKPYGDYVRWLLHSEPPDSREFWEGELRGFDSPNEVLLEPGG
ncbi:MAG TPA: condensation domain-containing protein, partial [Longimicrobiaceae bacterium]|nr:condensation domain-containing protein [Longimicrobiaceae bacterium]